MLYHRLSLDSSAITRHHFPIIRAAAAKRLCPALTDRYDWEDLPNVKKAVEWGQSVAETVSLTGISMSSVKRYRKQIKWSLSAQPTGLYLLRAVSYGR